MTFNALTVLLGLTALFFLFAAIRNLGLRRIGRGLMSGAAATILLLIVACAVMMGANLHTYQPVSYTHLTLPTNREV